MFEPRFACRACTDVKTVCAEVSTSATPTSDSGLSLVDSQPVAEGATAGVAVVYADGSVSLVSVTGDSNQQSPEVTKVLAPSDEGGRDLAATAVDAASGRLAVVLRSDGGATSAFINSLEVC